MLDGWVGQTGNQLNEIRCERRFILATGLTWIWDSSTGSAASVDQNR